LFVSGQVLAQFWKPHCLSMSFQQVSLTKLI
jgi:hypothetical protein